MLVWLASYPRSGSTFTRLLLHQIYGITTYSQYKDGKLLGGLAIGHEQCTDFKAMRENDQACFCKTHSPNRSGPGDKVLYIVRDGRDAICSYSRFRHGSYNARYVVALIQKFNPRYCWHRHVESWINTNPAIIKFEELINSPVETIVKAVNNLGLELNASKIKPPTFEELHDSYPSFFTRGRVGEYLEYQDFPYELFWQEAEPMMKKMGYSAP